MNRTLRKASVLMLALLLALSMRFFAMYHGEKAPSAR